MRLFYVLYALRGGSVMSIDFKVKTVSARFLDPNDGFTEKKVDLEYRTDPLTGDFGLVRDRRFTNPHKPDLAPLIENSRRNCPFCPGTLEEITPRFIPAFRKEGHIKIGEATVFPNLFPTSEYGAVTVISKQHHIPLSEFKTPLLTDAFLASREYLKTVAAYDGRARYCGVMWNYFPPANSSQVHPHLQPFAGPFPLSYHKKLLVGSKWYLRKKKVNFWQELIQDEKKGGTRYIGEIGRTAWLASFVPRSFQMDVRVVFQKRNSIMSLTDDDLRDMVEGLTRVFKYMDEQNYYSFNLFLYSGLPGDDSFWTQARIIQRGPLPFVEISDGSNATLLGDTHMTIRSPEYICEGLRPYFS